ncbi:hypothetical protein ABZS83_37220, partial [Streptomyces sp. NPDC005426]|uniref:hypothetical protein n=1 Tax=Streptomyces sp. NPDC005426 TaxID=3155344 RepID=UPI0033B70919
ANTAYNGFPLLGSILAQDRYLPRQLLRPGPFALLDVLCAGRPAPLGQDEHPPRVRAGVPAGCVRPPLLLRPQPETDFLLLVSRRGAFLLYFERGAQGRTELVHFDIATLHRGGDRGAQRGRLDLCPLTRRLEVSRPHEWAIALLILGYRVGGAVGGKRCPQYAEDGGGIVLGRS